MAAQSDSRITFHEVLENGNNLILKGQHKMYGEVAVKMLKYRDEDDMFKKVREAFLQARLRHPWVCQVLDMETRDESDGKKLLICLKLLRRNLAEEIEERKRDSRRYSEEELWRFLKGMVDILAEAQTMNIFIGNTGEYKIGDFGEAKILVECPELHTVVGTIRYMSPILTQAIVDKMARVVHNPFRSDVYSLGMTVFAMATLDASLNFDNEQAISALPYSEDLKAAIRGMITKEESWRPDFLIMKTICDKKKEPLHSKEERELLETYLNKHFSNAFTQQFSARKQTSRNSSLLFAKKQAILKELEEFASDEVYNRLNTFPNEYIPISALVSDPPNPYNDKSLIISTNGSDIARIDGAVGSTTLCDPNRIPICYVRRLYGKVTISEPPIESPALIVKLIPEKKYIVSEGQIYRMGNCPLEILTLNRERIELQDRSTYFKKEFSSTSGEIRIGAASNCEFISHQIGVSQKHAVIHYSKGVWTIEDTRSRNGIYVHCHSTEHLQEESREIGVKEGRKILCDTTLIAFRFQ